MTSSPSPHDRNPDGPASTARNQPDPVSILTSIGEAVYDWDLATDTLAWSPNARDVLGVDSDRSIATGRAFHELTSPVSASSRRESIIGDTRADKGAGVSYRVRYALQGGGPERPETVWVDDTGRWFAGAGGRARRAHGLVRVVSSRGQANRDLPPPRADHDPLTGCLSRARLMEIAGTHLARGGATPAGFGLLLIAVDDLARLNRAHGYDAVDELLAGIAAALRGQIRSTDCLARYSGNRFALLLGRCDPAQIGPAAIRALDVLGREPILTGAGPLRPHLRIGGVLAPRHGRGANILMLNAEQALEGAAVDGFALFDPASARTEDARRSREMAGEIVAALNEGRVRIALQPVVAARSGEPVMAEALVRIESANGDLLAPASFLPAADEADLLRLLDHRVLDLVAGHLRETSRTVSVNVAPSTLRDPAWPAHVAAVVRLNPGIASRLVFEIGEAAAAADIEGSARAMEELSKLGIRFAIDHFGAGHASLRTLRRLHPDFLKIDGAFVQNVARSPDDRFLVRSLIGVARLIGAPVIAEWVENAEIAATLTEWGAPYLQGVHFGGAELAPDLGAAAAPPRTAFG